MLNADDKETIFSPRRLKDVLDQGTRPLVLWIGAGASRWMNYPSGKELTLHLRRDFFHVGGFDNPRVLKLIDKEDFPSAFELCKQLDSQRYYRFLADAFSPQVRHWSRA